MVVTLRPATIDSGATHDRMGLPSRWTVHAPQSAIPQPNLVPGSPATSRTAHSRGMLGSASSVVELPLSTNDVDMDDSVDCRGPLQSFRSLMVTTNSYHVRNHWKKERTRHAYNPRTPNRVLFNRRLRCCAADVVGRCRGPGGSDKDADQAHRC